MNQLLRDPNIEPSEKVLKKELGKNAKIFEEFITNVTNPPFDIQMEWRYYNDGKSWLCKAIFKKKTVFWLSVWEDFFKLSFFFTEKTKEGVLMLDIDKKIKTEFENQKTIGKLIPLLIDVSKDKQLKDIFKIIDYKKSLK